MVKFKDKKSKKTKKNLSEEIIKEITQTKDSGIHKSITHRLVADRNIKIFEVKGWKISKEQPEGLFDAVYMER